MHRFLSTAKGSFAAIMLERLHSEMCFQRKPDVGSNIRAKAEGKRSKHEPIRSEDRPNDPIRFPLWLCATRAPSKIK
ncbi:MFS transporter, putative [Anopheles sinensis]|uniref:MFS transporter, putative n=1 Tax=Anopheles sinensis TaxID=74873 RepID=A0A084WT09_ANOSI|nr:MFS transporter, putative [Anopheles sinensis]